MEGTMLESDRLQREICFFLKEREKFDSLVTDEF